jgi:peptidoglycan hydrolase CwlO-like protein
MSRPLVTITVINTFTTALFAFLYKLYNNQKVEQEHKIEYLMKKIENLEKTVVDLQQSIEDLEENIHNKNDKIIQSNIALNNKLDDFINYSYDIYDDD